MGQIDFTNIIIDDFRKGKLNPFNKYIYILTHIHSDHLRGLSNSWNYGPIYCSKITANLILNKFPNLAPSLKILPIHEPCKITLAQNIIATVTFLDANHCAGAVMVLLEGYFGRFLYSGDCRFDRKKFSTYTYLYPPQNSNQKFDKCSRPIDKMWLDNTFCNPRFKFMTKNQALDVVLDFVKKNNNKKVYIGMDYYGKQQVLIHIARQLDTIIVVDQARYENIIAMEFDRELFTTNPDEGHIYIIQKPLLHDKLLEDPQAIGLVMSGWCLNTEWRKVKGTNQSRIYYIPYSLHSNYDEIVGFVKSLRPSQIQPIVSVSERGEQGGNISTQAMYNTEGNSQAFSKIVKQYTSPLSETYTKNLNDKQFQQSLKKRLGLDRKSAEINKAQLGLNTISMPARGKGYKLTVNRNETQIRKVKQELQRRRNLRFQYQKQQVQIFESDGDSQIQFIERSEVMAVMKKIETNKEQQKRRKQMKQMKLEKPDWTILNKMQIIKDEDGIEHDLKQRIADMIISLQ